MEQIVLKKEDLVLLKSEFPGLKYHKKDNQISGCLKILREYEGKLISDEYHIEFKLITEGQSILPIVKETKGKVLSIANRKKLPISDLHLNSKEGQLCLIFPIKEREVYPNGFDLKVFLNHLEEHFYWISYFDRYNEKPWDDEPHSYEEALKSTVKNDKNYRKELKIFLENRDKRKYSRPEFRRYLKENNLLWKRP